MFTFSPAVVVTWSYHAKSALLYREYYMHWASVQGFGFWLTYNHQGFIHDTQTALGTISAGSTQIGWFNWIYLGQNQRKRKGLEGKLMQHAESEPIDEHPAEISKILGQLENSADPFNMKYPWQLAAGCSKR